MNFRKIIDEGDSLRPMLKGRNAVQRTIGYGSTMLYFGAATAITIGGYMLTQNKDTTGAATILLGIHSGATGYYLAMLTNRAMDR